MRDELGLLVHSILLIQSRSIGLVGHESHAEEPGTDNLFVHRKVSRAETHSRQKIGSRSTAHVRNSVNQKLPVVNTDCATPTYG